MCNFAGSKSQSTECVEYVFDYETASNNRVKVHVIDTPGLSDTEGDVHESGLT